MQEEPGLVRVPALHRRLLASVPDVDAPAVVEPADEDTVVAVPNELRRQFPLTWDAPSFTLPDEDGQMHSLHEYHGRPVLVVFYLGDGCLHCSRQLKGFAPVAADFEDQGISILGITTDDVASLEHSFATYKGRIPFPIVSDASLQVFARYGLHQQGPPEEPLHGTFLVDAAGKIRWRDSGDQPFMDTDFLLRELPRLLRTTNDQVCPED